MYTDIWQNIDPFFDKPISSTDCSLGFLLLSLFNQSQTCCLLLQTGMHKASLQIQRGQIVGGRNIPQVLEALSISSIPNEDLSDLLGRAMSKGHPPNLIFESMGRGLGQYLAAANRVQDATFELKSFEAPEVKLPISSTLLTLFLSGVDASLTDEQLENRFNRMLRFQIVVLDVDWTKVRLSPQLIGVLRSVEPDSRLASVLKSTSYSGRWRHINHLVALGLLVLKSRRVQNRTREEAPSIPPQNQEKIDMLSAFGDEPELIPSYQILGLTTPGMVNEITIAERYRTLSSQYHPDRFMGLAQSHQSKAQCIFERVASAYQELENEDLWEELKARLDAEGRGEKYVTNQDRQEGELLYAQAKLSFRRKAHTEAAQYVRQGLEADPYNWRLQFLDIQLDVILYHSDKKEAAEKLVRLDGPRAHEKVEVLFLAGEYFMQSGEPEQAYSLFEVVVEKSPEHIGARRHLRLRNMRSVAAEDEPAKKGFWGGLLSGRGKK